MSMIISHISLGILLVQHELIVITAMKLYILQSYLILFQDDPPIPMTTKEEIPVGTVIGKLEAIDEDIGENAAIDYAITGKSNCYSTT